MQILSYWPWALLIALLFYLIRKAVVRVRPGYCYTIDRLGSYHRVLRPGIHLLIPLLEEVGRMMNMEERSLVISEQQLTTRDGKAVTVAGQISFTVVNVVKASYEVNDLEYAMHNLVATNIRTIIGTITARQLQLPEEINQRLLAVVDAASEPWGVTVAKAEVVAY